MLNANTGLVFDWNNLPAAPPRPAGRVLLADESLRDGLQSASVRQPAISEKIPMLHYMESLGIAHVNLGFPGSGEQAARDTAELGREMVRSKMNLKAYCAARTVEKDITAISEASERSGLPMQAAIFIGSSPVRQQVEGWDVDFLLRTSEKAIRYALSLGLEVMFVTEDTTRSKPETLKRLYQQAIELGAKSIVLCDTCGYSSPEGTAALIRYIAKQVIAPLNKNVRIDWHGHSDRGLGLANALAALQAGADCIHGCILGVGERAGNTQLDQLIVNLSMEGISPWADQDLSILRTYCEAYSAATGVPVPRNYPVFGADAFSTASGIHASAVAKAKRAGNEELADTVYSGVRSRDFGGEQTIAIGPQSGRSNIAYWLSQSGLPVNDEIVDHLLLQAKRAERCLTEDQLWQHHASYVSASLVA
jgi:2-isopropylmalate synthase